MYGFLSRSNQKFSFHYNRKTVSEFRWTDTQIWHTEPLPESSAREMVVNNPSSSSTSPSIFLSVCVCVYSPDPAKSTYSLLFIKAPPHFFVVLLSLCAVLCLLHTYARTHINAHPIRAHLKPLCHTLSIIQCLHSNRPDLQSGSGDIASRQAHWAKSSKVMLLVSMGVSQPFAPGSHVNDLLF